MIMGLHKKVSHIIDTRGKIAIDDYLHICLYDDEFGYYKKQVAIGGKTGDFITAPEISQLFGDILALFIITQWQQHASSQIPVHIVELGPGKGTLMQDMCRIFKKIPSFFNVLQIHLVDINPLLKEQQKNTLNGYNFIHWYDNIKHIPVLNGFTFILANEFFDALPIKQYIRKQGVLSERFIVKTKKGRI